MLTPTLPSPLCAVTGVVNEIQLASVAAVHGQPPGADTAISLVPPPASTVRLSVRSSSRQAAACCDTRRRFSLTTISASRTDGRGLGAALNATVPVPCPEVGDRPESQFAPVETSQGHSGDVVTVMVAVPPSGPMLEDGTARATWHFSWVGPVATSELELHPPATAPALIAVTSSKAWHQPMVACSPICCCKDPSGSSKQAACPRICLRRGSCRWFVPARPATTSRRIACRFQTPAAGRSRFVAPLTGTNGRYRWANQTPHQ